MLSPARGAINTETLGPGRPLPLCLAFAACHGGSDQNALPSFVAKGSVVTAAYDGNNDDLLTGGLGASGLGSGPS